MNVSLYKEEVQNWIFEIQNNRGRDPEKLLSFCDKVEAYGQEISDDALIGFACFSRGETYYLLNDMRNFYAQMLSCLGPMERIGEWGYVAMANNMLGIMSLNRGNAPFAMDYYMKALGYCQSKKLPDLEWMIHMNIGALYLNLEEYQRSLDHLEVGYHYIIAHPEQPGYYESLMMVYLGMANAYLKMDNLELANTYRKKIETECKAYLGKQDMLVVDCFLAKLAVAEHRKDELKEITNRIQSEIMVELPIMDTFDDLYEYMELLLEIGEFHSFKTVHDVVSETVERTSIKNMHKKMLSLKIRYLKIMEQSAEYKDAAVQYYEISEQIEKDNRMMVNNMIAMRNSLNDLAQINQEVERENMALHRKSETDALTGIYNRFKLNELGDEILKRCEEKEHSFAIEILDIDYFKQYNDNYGHQEGDKAIQIVSQTISELRKHGGIYCFRYGGDEFVIIYEGYTKSECMLFAEELKHCIENKAVEHKYSKVASILTISQGVCWGIPKKEQHMAEFLRGADEMLYQVKRVSRNSIRVGQLEDVQ